MCAVVFMRTVVGLVKSARTADERARAVTAARDDNCRAMHTGWAQLTTSLTNRQRSAALLSRPCFAVRAAIARDPTEIDSSDRELPPPHAPSRIPAERLKTRGINPPERVSGSRGINDGCYSEYHPISVLIFILRYILFKRIC